jgi:hypothetical protein
MLLGGHASNMVVERELCIQQSVRTTVDLRSRLLDLDVQRATVLFIGAHLNVLIASRSDRPISSV